MVCLIGAICAFLLSSYALYRILKLRKSLKEMQAFNDGYIEETEATIRALRKGLDEFPKGGYVA